MTTYPEPLVARVTGVNRSRLADARKASLVKGLDWTLENATVTYSQDGLRKLVLSLGLEPGALRWPPAGDLAGNEAGDPAARAPEKAPVAAAVQQAQRAEAQRALVRLRVVRLCPNPTIVFCRAETPAAPEVQVRVRSNANFTPGMRLNARQPAPGQSLWHHEGQCPRWKGRY